MRWERELPYAMYSLFNLLELHGVPTPSVGGVNVLFALDDDEIQEMYAKQILDERWEEKVATPS